MRELMKKQRKISHELQILQDQLLIAERQIQPLRSQIQLKVIELSYITEQMRYNPFAYGRDG